MKYCHDCKHFGHPIDSDPCKFCWDTCLNEESELFLDKPNFELKEDDDEET